MTVAYVASDGVGIGVIGCGVITGAGAVLNRANVAPGQDVAVFGVGGIGLNVIQAARIRNAGRIIAEKLFPQLMTSWDRLQQLLQRNVPIRSERVEVKELFQFFVRIECLVTIRTSIQAGLCA